MQSVGSAIFHGSSNEYSIEQKANVVTVTDKVLNRDGSDTLVNIELLIFSDKTIKI